MRRIRFTKEHNGYRPGEEIEVDPGVADVIVAHARAAEYVGLEDSPVTIPENGPPAHKMMTDKLKTAKRK